MRRSVGLLPISACALGASAFLIPTGITPPGDNTVSFPSFLELDPKRQSIHVPCASCVLPSTDDANDGGDEFLRIQGGLNSLLMDFSISPDGEQLLLNGEAIYPMHRHGAAMGPSVLLPLMPSVSSPDTPAAYTPSTRLLEVSASAVMIEEHAISGDGDLVIPLTYRILALDQRQILDIDKVLVKMLKTDDGELLILEVSNEQSSTVQKTFEWLEASWEISPDHAPRPSHHSHQPDGCGVFCRLKSMVTSGITDLKQGKLSDCTEAKLHGPDGNADEHQPFARPHFAQDAPDGQPRRHYGRPHHMRPFGHHHHHHHRHSHHFVHAFVRGVAAVLIPTLAGITVGMAVSLLGLFVGRLISFVWMRSVRGGRRGYASLSGEEGDEQKDCTDENDNDIEPPPVYEEAPAYEDVATEQK